jgi:hypothetical protein
LGLWCSTAVQGRRMRSLFTMSACISASVI